jgi:hypothetical protein
MIFNTVLFPASHVGQLIIVPILNGNEAHFWLTNQQLKKKKDRLILLIHGKNLVSFQKAIS